MALLPIMMQNRGEGRGQLSIIVAVICHDFCSNDEEVIKMRLSTDVVLTK
ncbi:MAG: hypothetical protein J5663_11795 [Bacteroidaceae bacterium]|nr:hypothetical protein [Bacteroidaceae bacterium]